MRHFVRLCLATVVLAPVCVQSATLAVAFNRIDSDHNGYLSRAEARPVLVSQSRFDAADRNGDGLLDRDEYVSWGVAGATHPLAERDKRVD